MSSVKAKETGNAGLEMDEIFTALSKIEERKVNDTKIVQPIRKDELVLENENQLVTRPVRRSNSLFEKETFPISRVRRVEYTISKDGIKKARRNENDAKDDTEIRKHNKKHIMTGEIKPCGSDKSNTDNNFISHSQLILQIPQKYHKPFLPTKPNHPNPINPTPYTTNTDTVNTNIYRQYRKMLRKYDYGTNLT